MKNAAFMLFAALAFTSCKKETPKDYVTLSGTIVNQNSDSLIIAQRQIIKTIKVNPDGTFSDTLNIATGNYVLFDGKEQTPLYLKNNYNLKIHIDAKAFDESITYQGEGAETNNYLAKKTLLREKLIDYDALLNLEESNFKEAIETKTNAFMALLNETQNLDSAFVASQKAEIEMMGNQLHNLYEHKQGLSNLKGQKSPQFSNYENYKGGTTSLSDLMGKYVYIDMWATWCAPCKKEIPFLKEVEKKYHGKNIEFVSISLDKQTAYQTWRTMVKEKELSGIQLFAKEDKAFSKAYKITGIPRFILIDPQGNIIDADAPRPSNPKLTDVFNTLEI